ncbi:uncharacterized protein LOC133307764 [Gastrolobium bilobum]|uniref:uncharacterized protein LOC133307764 n=1 Tax=Gastrolobium bilobum TaxID=150636 RepID=UPI002AAFE725|nr:uncharacterized protein LOC133307764 [Gastrolobium bilobum]
MDFVNVLMSVVGRVGAFAYAPIIEQAGYLIFYDGNFKKLEDHIKVEEERRNGKEIETDVQKWQEKVNEVIEEANKLQEDPHRANVGCSGWLFPNLLLRHQLSIKATNMAKEVVEVQGKAKFDRVAYLPPLDGVGSSSGTSGSEKLETRESIKEDIMQALKDPKVHNIGVYGLGGMGKTHMVMEVAHIAKQDKLFDEVVMANVSKTPDLKTIQGEIADLLGLRFDEETVAGRASRLRQRIKAEKTILLVLDDIWTKLDLKKVGIPSKDEHNACKLLMTSRNQDVLVEMDAQPNFRVEVLSEAETWNLFQLMAGDVVKDINFQDIATQVAKKCAGLPIRLVTVAKALKNKDIRAWNDALRQLESVDHEGMDAMTYSALELSYKSLENDETQALFLLFAVIGPENSAEYFLKVAMGLDIFKHINTVEGARNRLYKIIGSLKASCLLLEGNISEHIQMHDLVREVAISIAFKVRNAFVVQQKTELNEWSTNSFLEQIILDACHELPQRLDCPNVKLFVLVGANRSLEIPDTIFEGMGSLKVLDLTYINLSSLPTSFRSLTNLQTLCLYLCILENMEEIGALTNLEILYLWKSSMSKLPSEIGKLTKLRMLDLSDSGIEVLPPNIISSLTKLEELYMGNTSIKWEVENSAKQNKNASLAELRHLSNLTALDLQIRDALILPRDLMFEKLERYKIVVGDVWEWSDNEDENLKTLKLKLGTNINLEYGIKALIKRVQNLYLDEVHGISNVLYQLNGEGFPLLKHLHIQNNAKMMHIVDSMGRNQVQVSFLNLEKLVLHNLKTLEKICHGPLAVNSFGKLRVIKVQNCNQLEYLLSFSMAKGLLQLSQIEVCQCNSMKKIVFGDCGASVAFPNLDTLKLSSLNLNKIWDGSQPSFSKLANLIVENCGELKYLFSSTMVGSFNSLKRLEISKCHLMDEIIATEERNNDASALNEVLFSKLETIILKDMKNLETIWHWQFDTVKTLQVKNCEKIVVVFPSSVLETYNNLEMVEVTDCALVEEIFELTSNEKSCIEDTTHLKTITLEDLPKLKKTWSRDPQGILGFHDIENVNVISCGSLDCLFPLSVAIHCSHLKELYIKFCGNMKEIVAEMEESTWSTPKFEFDELNILLLWSLPKLKGFYAGYHTLACPSLRKIEATGCAKLNLFKTLSTSSHERFLDDKLPVSVQQSLFSVEEVIPNLEWLRINHEDANAIFHAAQNLGVLFPKMTFLGLALSKYEEVIFPYWFLQDVCTLEHLVVEFSSYKKIFQDEKLVTEKISTRLKILELYDLPKLQQICEEEPQIDPVLLVLEELFVHGCPSLKNLLPSSVTFSHLTYLEIMNCNGMINLITSPTARSLVKLTTMKVKECNSLEEIMTGKGDETIYDIAFISLEILMLESLPSFNKFCSSKCFLRFPLLEEVVVRECPRMKIFSEGNTTSPNLRKVKIEENNEKCHWNGNLNDTIKNMFEDKVAFYTLKHLKLSEYPELKELWHGQLHSNVFSNLTHLVVHNCDFLSEVLFQLNLLEVLMNLEELDVRECYSLEAVFDVKGKSETDIQVENSTQLKKLKLSSLPNLKHVWKEDPHGNLSFPNLREVSVIECEMLTSLFPLSIARDMIHLQDLEVHDCGVEEIIAKDEGTVDEIKFEFPRLTSLELIRLHNLKAFFTGIHSLQCKSLKRIVVLRCEKLQLFKTQPMSYEERAGDDKLRVSSNQPLFTIEEVLANVERLTLTNKDFDIILQSQYSGDHFTELKRIWLIDFTDEEDTFPYWFLKNVPNLELLKVEGSSFTEIFQDGPLIGEERQIKISTRPKELVLSKLHKLQHICKEGFKIDPILQRLEHIYVVQCSSLINLVPSSVAFNNLTYLEVENCIGLINLITCSTAKNLVKLTTMKIKECCLFEDVVNGKEDETNNEIAFFNLQTLELISLPSLHRFCSCKCSIMFPKLEEVVVKECPRMEIFSLGDTSTPELEEVQIGENNNESRWEGDLNKTIKTLFEDKLRLHVTESNI